MKRTLSWAVALVASLTMAGNAHAYSFGTWCTSGGLVACFAASVETTTMGAGTSVLIRVQNLQGWAGSSDNTGGSLISRVGLISPDLQNPTFGDVDGSNSSVEMGTDPGSKWGVVNAIAGQIEFGSGINGTQGGIQGCEASNAGLVTPRFQTCDDNGWVELSFTTTNAWTAGPGTQLAIGWKSVDYDNRDFSFQCRMDGATDGSTVLPCGPVTTTPEPVSMALLGTGLAGLFFVRRRRRRESGDVTADAEGDR